VCDRCATGLLIKNPARHLLLRLLDQSCQFLMVAHVGLVSTSGDVRGREDLLANRAVANPRIVGYEFAMAARSPKKSADPRLHWERAHTELKPPCDILNDRWRFA